MSDIKVARYKIRLTREKHTSSAPFTLVFLSDLHNAGYGEGNQNLLAAVRNQSPAAVLVGGDMVTANEKVETSRALSLLDGLTKQYPVYYANGNHECRLKHQPEKYGNAYEKYSSAIKSLGVHLLENACQLLEIEKTKLAVWGCELPAEYFRRGRLPKLDGAVLRRLLGNRYRMFSTFCWRISRSTSRRTQSGGRILRFPDISTEEW